MRIEHIEECLDLAQTLNFTLTAQKFFITQPVLSKHISSMESELGVKLFLRDQRQVRLTEVGRIFIRHCEEISTAYKAALEDIRHHKEGITANIRVGFLREAGTELVSAAQAPFLEKHGDASLEYVSLEADDLRQALASDQVDIALMSLGGEFALDPYRVEELYDDELCAAMLDTNPLARAGAPLMPADLAASRIVTLRHELYPIGHSELMSWLALQQGDARVEESAQSIDTLPLLLSDSETVMFVPRHLAGHIARDLGHSCVFQPLENYPSRITIAALWKKSNERPYLAAYARVLRNVAKELHGSKAGI